MKLMITDEAKVDLIHIGDHIAQDNPHRALSFVEELEERCRALPSMPLLYPLVPRREASGIRRADHGNYLIFYRIKNDSLFVLHIVNGAMDYEALLFPDG